MADEASGQDVEFPADMKLRNVVKLSEVNDSPVVSHVSPLTDLVAKTAETASGGLTASNIAQAKTGITAALGFDPEKVKPVNSNSDAAATASLDERMQSLTLAAISKLALDSRLGCMQPTVSARIGCVVKEVAKAGTLSGDKLTLGEIVRGEVRAALVAVAASPTINHTGAASVVGYAAFAQGVLPTAPGAPTGVASAKKLFGSLRTNLQAWSDSNNFGGKLFSQAAAREADFKNGTGAYDEELLAWVKISAQGIEHLANFKAGVVTSADIEFVPTRGSRAKCSVFIDAAASVKAGLPADALNVACSTLSIGAPIDNLPPISNVLLGSEIIITPVAGQPTGFTYKARATRATGIYDFRTDSITNISAKTTVGTYGSAAADRATGSIAYTRSGADLASITITGMMPARMLSDGTALTDHQMWKLSAVRTPQADKIVHYALSGELVAYTAGVVVGKFAVNQGSFMRVFEDALNPSSNAIKEYNLSVESETGHSKITGSLHRENFVADKIGHGYAPTKITFEGSLSSGDAQFFSGTLVIDSVDYAKFNSALPESSTNFVKQTASLMGSFTVPLRPPLVLIASASRQSPDSIQESLQYNDGTVVFTASRVTDGTAAPVVNLVSADGISFKLNEADKADIDVMKDSAKVAVINVKSGVITYVDGSLESFK
jgi:hypothetical protein